RGVPDANCVVVAGGREPVAVVTERHVGDEAGVGVDRECLAAGGAVQEADGAVVTGQGDQPSVRGEGDGAAEVAAVYVGRDRDLLRRGRVPGPDDPFPTRPGEVPRVRAEAGAQHVLDRAPKRREFSPGGHVPGLDGAVATGRQEALAIETEGYRHDV